MALTVQLEFLPVISKGRDILCISSTGSGQTTAIGIAVCQLFNASRQGQVQAVLLCHSKVRAGQVLLYQAPISCNSQLVDVPNLACVAQVTDVVQRFQEHMPGFKACSYLGRKPSKTALANDSPTAIIATPSRVLEVSFPPLFYSFQ